MLPGAPRKTPFSNQRALLPIFIRAGNLLRQVELLSDGGGTDGEGRRNCRSNYSQECILHVYYMMHLLRQVELAANCRRAVEEGHVVAARGGDGGESEAGGA